MDEETFRAFLKRGGRSASAVSRVVAAVRQFGDYLQEHRSVKTLDEADAQDLEAFVAWLEQTPKTSAKIHLWAARYYYEYAGNQEMQHLAAVLREQRIHRRPFALKGFRGVDTGHLGKLAAIGIRDVSQMLEAGRTPAQRRALAARTGIPLTVILEFVKLSDLARIPGVKGIRARLYYKAGVDTAQKMAAWDPAELRAMIVDFVERTAFEGVATLPAEARFTVAQARKLPQVVQY